MEVMERIKAVNANRIDIDEAVELLALGTVLRTGYESVALPIPTDLEEGLTSLRDIVAGKRKEALKAALRAAEARRAGLATAEEKRKREDEEIARLKAMIG